MKWNKNIKILINYLLGPLLFIWLSFSIYNQVRHQPNLGMAWKQIQDSLNSPKVWNLVLVLTLMIVNWAIEAVKWKLSVQIIQKINFIKAFKAVLSGVSFSVSTPNRMGEYLGRVLYMEEGNRLRTISLTIVSSMSQLIITLLMGSVGIIFLMPKIQTAEFVSVLWVKVLLYGVVAALIVLTVFYFRLSWLIRWIDRFPRSNRYTYLVTALEDLNATLLLKLLSLSLIRFIVFIIQYYLLFRLFGTGINWWQGFWAVSVSFIILSIIPTFAIAELGLRGKVSLKLLGLFSMNDLGITIATGMIWFINLVVPAIIGSLLILGIKKIVTNKDEKT
jgi:hypothetical protein